MKRLKESILRHGRNLPEGVPLAAKGLLYLGSRAAIDQALSRLARRGELLRVGRGLYVLPIESRFGNRGAVAPQDGRGRLRRSAASESPAAAPWRPMCSV